MSQAGLVNNAGGGGGGSPIFSLTGNTGVATPIANNVNDRGLAANTGGNAFPLFSYGTAGNLQWENRAYWTPYVVDASTTNGRKGTFTTIQSAITQADADGAETNGAIIYIRPGVYTENLTIPATGLYILTSAIPANHNNLVFNAVTIDGTITQTAGGSLMLDNIVGGSTLTCTSGFLFINNSTIPLSVTTATEVKIYNSYIPFTSSIGANTLFDAFSTRFDTVNLNSGNAATRFHDCTFNVGIAGQGAGVIGVCEACVFEFNPPNITGTFNTLILTNCTFESSTGNCITATGNILYTNLSLPNNSGGADLFNGTPTQLQGAMTAGNVIMSRRVAGDITVTVNDIYLGVTDTSATRTVTLPSANLQTNQTFIVKDESGGAATNNITVTVNGGVKTIDGSTTFALNTNYGSINVIYDGTNYFIW